MSLILVKITGKPMVPSATRFAPSRTSIRDPRFLTIIPGSMTRLPSRRERILAGNSTSALPDTDPLSTKVVAIALICDTKR